jgi:hypothetical protein
MLRNCIVLLLLFSVSISGYSQQKDSTANALETVPDYRRPRSLYLNSYEEDFFIHDSYEYESRDWEIEEELYMIGWSENGLVAYAAEPPEDGCDCYFFELIIKDADKDSIVWFYHYDNSDVEPHLRYGYEDNREIEAIDFETSVAMDTIHNGIYEIWNAESNLFKHTLHHFGISAKRQHHRVAKMNKSATIDFDDSEENPVVRINMVFENDTFQTSYIANGTTALKSAFMAGYVADPNDDDRILVFIQQRWERAKNGRNSIIDYKVIGMNRYRNPGCTISTLPEPTFGYYNIAKPNSFQPITLLKKKEESSENWWKGHKQEIGLQWHFGKHLRNDTAQKELPQKITKRVKNNGQTAHLSYTIETEKEYLAFYGNAPNKFGNVLDPLMLSIYPKASESASQCYDFSNYTYLTDELQADSQFVIQELRWAVLDGNTLYVSNAHRTYASASKGKNAYITAIDITTGKVIWRSNPKVANANNFILSGDVIISGYGFSEEADYIYLLNKHTGKTVKKIAVESAPEWFAKTGNTLYLQTFNSEHQFEIKGK